MSLKKDSLSLVDMILLKNHQNILRRLEHKAREDRGKERYYMLRDSSTEEIFGPFGYVIVFSATNPYRAFLKARAELLEVKGMDIFLENVNKYINLLGINDSDMDDICSSFVDGDPKDTRFTMILVHTK